jgi:SprT protein
MLSRVTLLLRQLDFYFEPAPASVPAVDAAALQRSAADLLRRLGCRLLSERVQVEWNSRLRTCAGRADTRRWLISLNPRLTDHGTEEIERTVLHELAHLLAQFRAGRRRLLPHGVEWQKACDDLGIPGEARCHNLPFKIQRLPPRYHYRCPHCARNFPRVRKLRRKIACLACCRQYANGKFDRRYQLRLVG